MPERPRVPAAGLLVDTELRRFGAEDGLDVTADAVWEGLARLVARFGARKRRLLADRGRLQRGVGCSKVPDIHNVALIEPILHRYRRQHKTRLRI